MSKKPVSLEMQLRGQEPPEAAAEASMAKHAPAVNPNAQEKTTVYMPRAAMRCLKQMALDQDKRINDLLQEGLELMFEKYGQPSLSEFTKR
jgi:predicted RNase H-like nuclease